MMEAANVSRGRGTVRGRRTRTWAMLTAVGVLAASGYALASPASAKTTTPAKPASGPTTGKTAPLAPTPIGSKVKILSSGALTAPNGLQTYGASPACPGTKQPAGGGVFIQSTSLFANVNSSRPNGKIWEGWVDNLSGADTTFTVYVVCAPPGRKYTVVSNSVDNPAGVQTQNAVSCPIGTKVRGGGGFASSSDPNININTSIPIGTTGWRVDINNAGGGDNTSTVYAVCSGKPAGLVEEIGTTVDNPNGSQTFAAVGCPSGSPFVLSGGAFSNSPNVAVNMNSTNPFGNGAWEVYENNASGGDASITPYALCIT